MKYRNQIIPDINQRDILIYAFRYTLGRSTYAPHTVMDVLKRAWFRLSKGDRNLYIREIREAEKQKRLGMEMDEKAWVRFVEWAEMNIDGKEENNGNSS